MANVAGGGAAASQDLQGGGQHQTQQHQPATGGLSKIALQPMKPAPGEKFMKRDVERVLKEQLEEKLTDKVYNYEDSLTWSKELSGDIQTAVRALGYVRYKIIVTVSIVEACQQGIRLASRCLWDTETDNFAEHTLSTETMHATALVFGLYWE